MTAATARATVALLLGAIALATSHTPADAQSATRSRPLPSIAYLAWQETDDGPTTELIDANGSVLARARMLIVSTGTTLRAIERRRRTTRLQTCAEIMREVGEPGGPDSPPSHATVTQLILRDLASGQEAELVPAADTRGVADLSQDVIMTAGLGDQIFVRHRVWSYGCGAHGEAEVRGLAFSVERGQRLAPTLVRGDAGAAAAALQSQLAREHGADAAGEAIGATDIEVVESLPLARAGSLLVRSRYLAGVAYAYGDDTWDSYARTAVIDVTSAPPAWAQYAREVPAPVLARLDREGTGISTVRGDAVALARAALVSR